MIDLELMQRLLSSLRDDSKLVLLGDADQLPSVDAGAVFRDLCARERPGSVRLSRSYRMDASDPAGRAILAVASHVHRGDAAGCYAAAGRRPRPGIVEHRKADDVRFEGVERLPMTERSRFLARWRAERLLDLPALEEITARWYLFRDGRFRAEDTDALLALLAHQERSRVLCITRGRATGVASINAWFHGCLLDEAVRAKDLPPGPLAIMRGEPVLVTRNDYDRDLLNGDQGVVLGIVNERGHARLAAVFKKDDQIVAHPLDAVRSIVELAYAVTVHKAQGSEHDHVALVLPETDTRLLTRELIYTGLTRARRSVTVIGDRDLLALAIARVADRRSGLVERLGYACPA
jgi:exodeoxyribonuclease V alpha subunit